MENKTSIQTIEKESPSHFADRLGVAYTSSVTQQHKKENGQFFTPVEIAELMASYSEFDGDSIRILDPGCGSAVLSCALIERIADTNKALRTIELVAYETDFELIPISQQALDYLEKWGIQQGIKIKTNLHTEDFILHNSDCFKETRDLFYESIEKFDIVISNPPYFKLPIDDKRVKVAKIIVNGHPNIYAIFMA